MKTQNTSNIKHGNICELYLYLRLSYKTQDHCLPTTCSPYSSEHRSPPWPGHPYRATHITRTHTSSGWDNLDTLIQLMCTPGKSSVDNSKLSYIWLWSIFLGEDLIFWEFIILQVINSHKRKRKPVLAGFLSQCAQPWAYTEVREE